MSLSLCDHLLVILRHGDALSLYYTITSFNHPEKEAYLCLKGQGHCPSHPMSALVAQIREFFFARVKYIVGANGHQHFPRFPHFHSLFFFFLRGH